MTTNPFTLDFGAKPSLFISRTEEQDKIISTFTSDAPSTHMYLILGAGGTGKTVLMTTISHILAKQDHWIHIDLNVETDLLTLLAAGIEKATSSKFPKIKFQVNLKADGFSLESETRYSNIQTDLDAMITTLQSQHIRLLITMDEVIHSQNVRAFTTYFQHCLREGFPVFVLMTGLYKNVRALENHRSQTFLRRAPKVTLVPLNMARIARHFQDIFSVSYDDALTIANHTAGYSFGFQMLGYLLYDSKKTFVDEDILFEYRVRLEESSYEKIWEELSSKERDVVQVIAENDTVTNKEAQSILGMDANNFSTYKNTLEKSGILSVQAGYGQLAFALPYFREFVVHPLLP